MLQNIPLYIIISCISCIHLTFTCKNMLSFLYSYHWHRKIDPKYSFKSLNFTLKRETYFNNEAYSYLQRGGVFFQIKKYSFLNVQVSRKSLELKLFFRLEGVYIYNHFPAAVSTRQCSHAFFCFLLSCLHVFNTTKKLYPK